MENGKEPAFPIDSDDLRQVQTGLTKREYFAAMAMQGYCANEGIARAGITLTEKAQSAVMMADELIKELQK